jgi:hypothetical protein
VRVRFVGPTLLIEESKCTARADHCRELPRSEPTMDYLKEAIKDKVKPELSSTPSPLSCKVST